MFGKEIKLIPEYTLDESEEDCDTEDHPSHSENSKTLVNSKTTKIYESVDSIFLDRDQKEISLKVQQTFGDIFPTDDYDEDCSFFDKPLSSNKDSEGSGCPLKLDEILLSEQKEISWHRSYNRINVSPTQELGEATTTRSSKRGFTSRKGRVSKNLTRVDFWMKKVIRGLREVIRSHFKTVINPSQKGDFLEDCGSYYNWLKAHIENTFNLSLSHSCYTKLFAGISYLIFNFKFRDLLETDFFSEEEIRNITLEKKKFNMVNSPNNWRAKDRKYAFNHEVSALGKLLFNSDDEMKEVFFTKILGRKGTSVSLAKNSYSKMKDIQKYKLMLESYVEEIDESILGK